MTMAQGVANSVGRELVERAQRGEDEAWRVIFDDHYARLHRFFRSRVATSEQAEDLATEVLLQAFRSIDRFEWRHGASLSAWIFGIARHVLTSAYRTPRPLSAREDTFEPPAIRDEFLGVEILDALRRIPLDHRAALELRYIIGLSGAEAAAVMGRSHGAFRSLLLRATRSFEQEWRGPRPTPSSRGRAGAKLTTSRHERRSFPRTRVGDGALADVLIQDERGSTDAWHGQAIVDLGGGGALLRMRRPTPAIGAPLAVRLRLGTHEIQVNATVVRAERVPGSDVRRIALRFGLIPSATRGRIRAYVEGVRSRRTTRAPLRVVARVTGKAGSTPDQQGRGRPR